jgi:flagellar motor switch protein FliM
MTKNLSQEEIDALLRASRSPSAKESKARAGSKYVRCNFRQAGQVSKEQVRSVSSLHETFALRVTNSLGAYLRVGMDVNLISVEQIAFSEFLARLPYDLTYLASVNIIPLEAAALFQMDLSLAFPVIDLVLGGLGKDPPEERAITEIEENILENVMRIICRELQATWNTVFDAEFHFGRREVTQQVSGLMLASEKVLALGFEIRMPDATGLLSVAFPAVVSNALLRKLAVQWSQTRPGPVSGNTERLRERLQGTRFQVELSLPESPVRMEELLAIEAGKVMVLKHRVTEPIRLAVSGRNMFLAMPVSCGRQRGAQVTGILSLTGGVQKGVTE